jgi:hypothetical protein
MNEKRTASLLHYILFPSPLYSLPFFIIFSSLLHYILFPSPLYSLPFSIIFSSLLHYILFPSSLYSLIMKKGREYNEEGKRI